MNEKSEANQKWAKAMIEEYEAPFKKIITQKWAIGFNDRGMGHGDYGIVVDRHEPTEEEFDEMSKEEILEFHSKPPTFVAGPLPKIIVEHIIEVHNASIEG